jgi:hypothetical protein
MNLRKLSLIESSISFEDLVCALRVCPNLKSFTYTCGGAVRGEEQFEPKQATEQLLRFHQSNLEELTLDFGAHFYNFLDDTDEIERVGDLRPFKALKYLSIRQEDLIGWNYNSPQCVNCGIKDHFCRPDIPELICELFLHSFSMSN